MNSSLALNTTFQDLILPHLILTQRAVAGRIGHGGGGTTTLKVYTAFVSEADQRAAGVFLTRMPDRPAPLDPDERVKTDPRYPYERIAATLHEAWRTGQLVAGKELTLNSIAETHSVSVGTAHRVMTLLQRWNMVLVHTGKPSVVLPSPASIDTETPAEQGSEGMQPAAVQPPSRPVPVPQAVPEPPSAPELAPNGRRLSVAGSATASTAAESARELLKLELIHLGTTVRTMTAHADPADFGTLERLMLDAVRRAGGDLGRIGEYEMAVHRAGNTEPIATVVVAA